MKITFHYTFLLVAISFILTGYFSNLIIFTSIILIHELGHYHAAKINNLKVDKIIIKRNNISDFIRSIIYKSEFITYIPSRPRTFLSIISDCLHDEFDRYTFSFGPL